MQVHSTEETQSQFPEVAAMIIGIIAAMIGFVVAEIVHEVASMYKK